MYLVRLPNGQPVTWLFVHADPRNEGCVHPVQSDVLFEDDAANRIKAGYEVEAVCVARSITDRSAYRRFVGGVGSVPAGYEPLNGTALELSCWASFAAWQAAPEAVKVEAPTLSEREAESIRLIALGYSNKEIAFQLGLSVKTVETYKQRSLKKLAMRSRVDIVQFAAKRGWLNVDGRNGGQQ